MGICQSERPGCCHNSSDANAKVIYADSPGLVEAQPSTSCKDERQVEEVKRGRSLSTPDVRGSEEAGDARPLADLPPRGILTNGSKGHYEPHPILGESNIPGPSPGQVREELARRGSISKKKKPWNPKRPW
eukprot:gnl/MRDRNA2_/MRDRNA2_106269_c0_seq1.p1 gnl/MRDRNA2_/MRDRNA2_106269_c0~~gnl/MRDRNA2_/MRDRNA2_106269_c0_seq1.p1  ORF type:complete len:131 (+),score=16.18 gnl/MRDRNA2_/MRDRNA2_106269_c0_seq1:107-499(+)